MDDDGQLLSKVERAARKIDVSRAFFYELIRSGEVESVKIGRSRRVSREALDRYVASLTGDGTGSLGSGDAA
jgi:excisionase family DNA binding protein